MVCTVNKTVAGVGPDTYRIVLNHVGTSVTIVEDPGNFITSAEHNTTGIIDVTWNQSNAGTNSNGPGMSGIVCIGNVVGHLVNPTAATCQVNTKLVSTAANFTAGRIEFLVTRG